MPHAKVGGHQYSLERAFVIGFFVFDNLFDVLTAFNFVFRFHLEPLRLGIEENQKKRWKETVYQ
jgi:hypothetical protein